MGRAYSMPLHAQSGDQNCTTCIGGFLQCKFLWNVFLNVSLLFCLQNIVFGFFEDSFIGVEQRSPHMVEVGYQKGAAQAKRDLRFKVTVLPDTASKFYSNMA